jgi:hypothetical protein
MIYLEACRGPSVVAITHDVGTRVPMASTAMGRAYLFSLPDVDRNKQIDAIRRRWRDDWTKVKTGLERSFKELADRGFCVTWGEWLPELCGVGVPLRNTDGTAAYAVNASAPIYQISRDRLEADWGPRLVKVARDIRTGMAAQPSATAGAQRQSARVANGKRPAPADSRRWLRRLERRPQTTIRRQGGRRLARRRPFTGTSGGGGGGLAEDLRRPAGDPAPARSANHSAPKSMWLMVSWPGDSSGQAQAPPAELQEYSGRCGSAAPARRADRERDAEARAENSPPARSARRERLCCGSPAESRARGRTRGSRTGRRPRPSSVTLYDRRHADIVAERQWSADQAAFRATHAARPGGGG